MINHLRDASKYPKPFTAYDIFPRMKPYLTPEQEEAEERKQEELELVANKARMIHNQIFWEERSKLGGQQTSTS